MNAGNMGTQKFEARRNVAQMRQRVQNAQPSRDTSAWRKGNKRLYKVVDGRKMLREREVKQENVTINKKLNKIVNEDRRKLTKEYAPGFRVGQVSGGMCIDCYQTENPLVKLYSKLHNRQEVLDKEAKKHRAADATLKKNIRNLRSPYSAQECAKFYKYNRYRARFFLDKKDNDTALHLNLTPEAARARKKAEHFSFETFSQTPRAGGDTDKKYSAWLYRAMRQSQRLREERAFRLGDRTLPSEKWDESLTPSGEMYRSGLSGYQFGLGLQRTLDQVTTAEESRLGQTHRPTETAPLSRPHSALPTVSSARGQPLSQQAPDHRGDLGVLERYDKNAFPRLPVQDLSCKHVGSLAAERVTRRRPASAGPPGSRHSESARASGVATMKELPGITEPQPASAEAGATYASSASPMLRETAKAVEYLRRGGPVPQHDRLNKDDLNNDGEGAAKAPLLSPQRGEIEMLKALIEKRAQQRPPPRDEAIPAPSPEVGNDAKRSMRLLESIVHALDEEETELRVVVSDVGYQRPLQTFQPFEGDPDCTVMLTTSVGVVIEVDQGDEPLFVSVKELQSLAVDHPPHDLSGRNDLIDALGGLACLDKSADPPLFESLSDLSPIAEQMLCDCLMRAICVVPSETTTGFTLSIV